MQSGRGIAEVKERGSDKVDSSLNIQVVRPSIGRFERFCTGNRVVLEVVI